MGRASVTGKRWSFMSNLMIKKKGRDYMWRKYLISTPYFGIYLHHIMLPDQDRGPHDHPWNFWTFVLKGWYEERVTTLGSPAVEGRWISPGHLTVARRHRRFSLRRLKVNQLHKVTELSRGGAWTLCFVGRRQREWGFLVGERWIRWDLETNRGDEVFS